MEDVPVRSQMTQKTPLFAIVVLCGIISNVLVFGKALNVGCGFAAHAMLFVHSFFIKKICQEQDVSLYIP